MHQSIFLVSDSPSVEQCTKCCSKYHCCICPALKPMTLEEIKKHWKDHFKNAIAYQDKRLCRCHLPCRTLAHYHCPNCNKTLSRRYVIENHLKKCLPLDESLHSVTSQLSKTPSALFVMAPTPLSEMKPTLSPLSEMKPPLAPLSEMKPTLSPLSEMKPTLTPLAINTPLPVMTPTQIPLFTTTNQTLQLMTPSQTPQLMTPVNTPLLMKASTQTLVLMRMPTQTPLLKTTPAQTPLQMKRPTQTPFLSTQTPLLIRMPMPTPLQKTTPAQTPLQIRMPTQTPLLSMQTPLLIRMPTQIPLSSPTTPTQTPLSPATPTQTSLSPATPTQTSLSPTTLTQTPRSSTPTQTPLSPPTTPTQTSLSPTTLTQTPRPSSPTQTPLSSMRTLMQTPLQTTPSTLMPMTIPEQAPLARVSTPTKSNSSKKINVIKCPHCCVCVQKKNLALHINRKHTDCSKDVTMQSHLSSVCIDSRNGLSAVQRTGHGFSIPVHVQRKTWGKTHYVRCELEDCCQYQLLARRNGQMFSLCEHIRSLDYCCETVLEDFLEPSILEEMVNLKYIEERTMADCLKRQNFAEDSHAPFSVLVALGKSEDKIFVSIHEPTIRHYSRLGRVMVTYNSSADTWRCPCAKPRMSCPHKNIAKWHLFQTNRKLFINEETGDSQNPSPKHLDEDIDT